MGAGTRQSTAVTIRRPGGSGPGSRSCSGDDGFIGTECYRTNKYRLPMIRRANTIESISVIMSRQYITEMTASISTAIGLAIRACMTFMIPPSERLWLVYLNYEY